MLFYVADLVCLAATWCNVCNSMFLGCLPFLQSIPTQWIPLYVPALVFSCNTATMYVILCSWSYCLFGYKPGAMYGILCSGISLLPLQSAAAHFMLLYSPALLQPCNTVALYVILCCRSCLFGYKPGGMYVVLWFRISLPPLQSAPAHCMLLYGPALVLPFNTGPMYVILWCGFVCYSMCLI